MERVQDEGYAASITDRCLTYYEKLGKKSGIATCAGVLLEILHVRTARAHDLLASRFSKYDYLKKDVSEAVDELAALVVAHSTDSFAKTMSTLAHIYHVALRDEFYRARDLFLTANIQFEIVTASPALLVRYNRTVAQIHALLFLAPRPMPAEEIADVLVVARSNVSNSLRELQNYNLVRVVHLLGDRRRGSGPRVASFPRGSQAPPDHPVAPHLQDGAQYLVGRATDAPEEDRARPCPLPQASGRRRGSRGDRGRLERGGV